MLTNQIQYNLLILFILFFFPEQIYTKVQSSTVTEIKKCKKTLKTNKKTYKEIKQTNNNPSHPHPTPSHCAFHNVLLNYW